MHLRLDRKPNVPTPKLASAIGCPCDAFALQMPIDLLGTALGPRILVLTVEQGSVLAFRHLGAHYQSHTATSIGGTTVTKL